MFLSKFMKQSRVVNNMDIVSPVSGEIFPVEQVNDSVFSQQMLGQTISIHPQHGVLTFVAPANGILEVLYPCGHAYAVRMKNGIGILVHVGIDTVELNGVGFKILAEQGKGVYAGQPIVKVDIDKIIKAGYDPSVMVIVTENPILEKLSFIHNQRVNAADSLMII